jgi:hypothetical protein
MRLLNFEFSQLPNQSTLLNMREKLGNFKLNWRDYNTKTVNTKVTSKKQNSIFSVFNKSCKTDQQMKQFQTSTLPSKNWQLKSIKVSLQLNHWTMKLLNFELNQLPNQSISQCMKNKLSNSKLNWRDYNNKTVNTKVTSNKQNHIFSIFSKIWKTDQQLKLSQIWTLPSKNWLNKITNFSFILNHSPMKLLKFELSQLPNQSTLLNLRNKLDNFKLNWKECNIKAMSSEHTSNKQNNIFSVFNKSFKTDQQMRLLQT